MSTTPVDALGFEESLHSRGDGTLPAGARAAYSLSMKINPAMIADIGKASLPRCVQCGYLLLGLSTARCPECGEQINWPLAVVKAMERRLLLDGLPRWCESSALFQATLLALFHPLRFARSRRTGYRRVPQLCSPLPDWRWGLASAG